MKKIEMLIECPLCNGTGVYSGIAEGEGVGVICYECNGTGAYTYSYKNFTGRKTKKGIKRVYLTGSQYKLGTGKVTFSNGIGEIDMDKEGVSYDEFLNGKIPKHIRKLSCPMVADQGACHDRKGFVDKCNQIHGEYLFNLTECKNQANKEQCWDRFESIL